MAELLGALERRRAARAFSADPVPGEWLELLWKAVSVAPSHGNTQPTRILVPEGPDQRRALFDALSDGNQQWAGAAPVLVALASLSEHDRPQKNRDGSERELWAFHAGIATGNLLAQATELGLIAHPMAGFDEAAVRTVFGAPANVWILAVIAIGRPGDVTTLPEDLQARETIPRSRLPIDRLVVRGVWSERHGERASELRKREVRE